MKSGNVFTILALSMAVVLAGAAPDTASAAGHVLQPNEWFQSGSIICGLVREKWVPGRFAANGLFFSHPESRRQTLRKAEKASGAKRDKLLKQAARWKKRQRQEAPVCNAGPPAPKKWTVMVYMAADNNLAYQGLLDLDEMEAGGGSDANVNVVVQAEFNADELEQYGITAPRQFNRPNYNTFRYAVPSGSRRLGPDGSATDIGNRDMTAPAELSGFISWAKQSYPAERYALVLWNHGGGFHGLLQDLTSAGGDLMTLQGLKTALTGAGSIALLDFDMCLMAGYETTAAVSGLVDNVVFSQEVVPGDGNPYDTIVAALRANPGISAADLSKLFVQKFYESYSQDSRNSTTKSAFAMPQFIDFENALSSLAQIYTDNLPAIKTPLQTAAAGAQRYTIAPFKDLRHLNQAVLAALPAGALSSQIGTLIAQVDSRLEAAAFRLDNRYHSGDTYACPNVDQSHGLSVTLPSLSQDDLLSNTGPGSLAAYESSLSGKPWTNFLRTYLQGSAASSTLDLGAARPEWYLLWAEQAAQYGVDLDMVILEPDGNIYIPYIGTVTPNGTLTPDSYDTGLPFEGYVFNRHIQAGTYHLMALLYSDPNDYQPQFDVVYRTALDQGFVSLFSPNYPFLSKQVSWRDDPSFSLQKVLQDSYSDFRRGAYWCFGSGCPANLARSGGGPDEIQPPATRSQSAPAQKPRITRTQMRKVQSLLAGKRGGDPKLRAMIQHNRPQSGAPAALGTEYFWKRLQKNGE
jgi:hypothetical protein